MANFIKKIQFVKKVKQWTGKLNDINEKHNEYRKLRFQKMLDRDEREHQIYNDLLNSWDLLWKSNLSLKEKEKRSNEMYDVYINTVNSCIQRVKDGQQDS